MLLIHFGRVAYFYYQKKQNNKGDQEIADARFNTYLKLREETFALKPGDLGILAPHNNEAAFAIVFEIHTGGTLQTIAAFANGKVWSFNTDTARKHTGIREDSVQAAAIEAVAAAQYHFARMRRNNTGELLPGHIKFHILTNHDVYSADASMNDLSHYASEWEELADKAHNLIDAMGEASKNKPMKRVYTKIAVKRSRPANL